MSTPHGAIYRFSAQRLDRTQVSLEAYRGHVLLIVNTASRCGLTPQFAALEELYRAYHQRGFEVLGFPCNQFGNQEPGSPSEIGAFCQRNYGVSFPMFARIDVNGPAAHPIYRLLKKARPGFLGRFLAGRVSWNFTKFLVDRQGAVTDRFSPSTSPRALQPRIEALLNGQPD